MKKRSQIEEKFKWDIGLFKTEQEIEDVFKAIEQLTKIIPTYYGKFNDKEKFFEYQTKFKKEFLLIYKLSFYIGNTLAVDNSNTTILKLSDRFNFAMQKLNQATSFVDPQIDDLDEEYLKSLLLDERAKDLDVYIKKIIKNKKHKLDEKTSEVISKLGNSFSNSSSIHSILSDSEIPYEDAVDSNGKKYKVSHSIYSSLVSSKDKKLRETAFNSIMNGFGKFNKTLAELYISNLKSENDFNKLTNYKNSLEARLEDEDVPTSVFDNNLKNVQKNIPVLQQYIKTKATNQEKFAYYDLFKDEKINGKVTLQKGIEIMLKALSPLGEDYIKMVERKLNDKSIDFMPNLNKDSGAYCSDMYDCKTLILMNWKDDFNSLSTLVHEMGHCINAELFNASQPQEKAGITIFSAEIASTVNEILLNEYMLKNSKTRKEKLYYLNEFLEQVRSTIFRQTLFSEFELYSHTQIENETPITYEDLNNKYFELCKKYYGNSCILPKNLKFEWSRIPHFYRSFYVYSYSTGLLTAICIAKRILNNKEYTKNYIKFLQNGISRPAVEVLKEIDVDLTTDKPFIEAFKFIKNRLHEYKKAINC